MSGLGGNEGGGVDPIARLVQLLARLPGIGEKTATRLAFFIIKSEGSYAAELAEAVKSASTTIRLCERCQNLTSRLECDICRDARRDASVICVVEQVADLRAIERSHEFRGRYHVLHGAISPLDGIGPEQLKVRELLQRLGQPDEQAVKELIIATNPSVDGEATALYLTKILGNLGLDITRIASGLPIGGDFEYADPATISRALNDRRRMS